MAVRPNLSSWRPSTSFSSSNRKRSMSSTTPRSQGYVTQSMLQGRTPMPGAAPSSDVTSGLSSLVGGFNRAYGAAKSANEARYQQMLDIADQTTQQRATDIRSDYGAQASSIGQRLSRLGMSNTTVAPTMQGGVEREKQSALNRMADQMQQTKLGIMGRRSDPYPDLGGIQSIIAGIGSQYGGGQGLPAMLQALAGLQRGQ